MTTPTMTRAEFERWLAEQLLLGWRVSNPESVAKVRAAFRRGDTLAKFRPIILHGPLPGPLSS